MLNLLPSHDILNHWHLSPITGHCTCKESMCDAASTHVETGGPGVFDEDFAVVKQVKFNLK